MEIYTLMAQLVKFRTYKNTIKATTAAIASVPESCNTKIS